MLSILLIALVSITAQPKLSPDLPAFQLAYQPTSQPADRSSDQRPKAQEQMQLTQDIQYIERKASLDHLTSLDIYTPTSPSTSPRPILIYIHGGAWTVGDKSAVHEKPDWAFDNNWILVSINYRLSPSVMHPEHARDVAAAIAYVHQHADALGGDPSRIAIMGHSAGAHLAAIVASDESLLAHHDLSPIDLSAVILLDGAGYDIPAQMDSKLLTPKLRTMFETAFGTDPKVWVQASPTLQAQSDDQLPPLLGVHVPRVRSAIETNALVKAWRATGAQAQVHRAPDKNHATLNHLMGRKNDPDTRVVESFLRDVFDQD